MNREQVEEKVKGKMQTIARKVKEELPKNWGFIVLTFEFGEKGQLVYASDADRKDVIEVMKEFIEKTEQNYGNDTGKY